MTGAASAQHRRDLLEVDLAVGEGGVGLAEVHLNAGGFETGAAGLGEGDGGTLVLLAFLHVLGTGGHAVGLVNTAEGLVVAGDVVGLAALRAGRAESRRGEDLGVLGGVALAGAEVLDGGDEALEAGVVLAGQAAAGVGGPRRRSSP